MFNVLLHIFHTQLTSTELEHCVIPLPHRWPPTPNIGKAKMAEYEDDLFDDDASTHSLHSELGGFDVPIGAKKALISANEKLRRSTREKNPVSRFGYNDYMAYHYAFMMKMATVREPETFSEAAKDPRWIEAMNEEMQALRKNETWDLVPTSLLPG